MLRDKANKILEHMAHNSATLLVVKPIKPAKACLNPPLSSRMIQPIPTLLGEPSDEPSVLRQQYPVRGAGHLQGTCRGWGESFSLLQCSSKCTW